MEENSEQAGYPCCYLSFCKSTCFPKIAHANERTCVYFSLEMRRAVAKGEQLFSLCIFVLFFNFIMFVCLFIYLSNSFCSSSLDSPIFSLSNTNGHYLT